MNVNSAEMTGVVESRPRALEILDCLDGEYSNNIARDIRDGLTSSPRYIPCKYFYDARGSRLFEEICRLPEYYPTRTEISILREIAPHLMETLDYSDLVELGSGSSLKISILLDAISETNRASMRYIPVDISESAVIESSKDLLERYPELPVLGVVADFMCQSDVLPAERPKMLCFLGGTIGNMEEGDSISFLRAVSGNMRSDDTLLVGFDMVKSREIVEAVYNDSRGLTSEFNRNILNVVNNKLNADFKPHLFEHLAFFNESESRVEMHLRASRDVSVRLESIDMEVEFKEGETIHTENSRKFTIQGIEDMVDRAGLYVQDWYMDADGWFSLVLMGRKPSGSV